MYDFEAEKNDAGAEVGSGPARALLYLELPRVLGEYAASRAIDLVTPSRDVGNGRPVLVLPGFSANDAMTGRLRGHLRSRGFRVHGWGQGRNIGLTDALVDGLVDRFEELRKR